MKNNVIDLGTIEFDRVISEVEISGKVFEVSAVVSVDNSILFLENISKGMSARDAFCTFAFVMHSEAQKKKANAKVRDIFNAMKDDEALKIMHIVISTNTDAPLELWKLEIKDIFERFEVYMREYAYLSTRGLVTALNDLVETMTKQIASSWSYHLQAFRDSVSKISSDMMSSVKSGLTELKETAIKYFESRSELDPVMAEFGWGGLSAIPGNIIQYINANKSNLSTDEVSELITSYYEGEDYKELDILVSSWWWNPHFSSRKLAISEALSCFKLKLNIASLTLITIHMEGIIKEFLSWSYGIDRSKNRMAIMEVREFAYSHNGERIPYIYECYIKALEEIEKRLTEDFDIKKLEATSNLSRPKIAHGHMSDEVSRAEVLKTFLWVNELENLLSSILKNNGVNKKEV